MAENETARTERNAGGVVRVRFVENPSEKKPEFFEWSEELGRDTKRFGVSPLERQRRFLAELHAAGFEPFDGDEDGTQYWRRPPTPDAK